MYNVFNKGVYYHYYYYNYLILSQFHAQAAVVQHFLVFLGVGAGMPHFLTFSSAGPFLKVC